jgi:hypothetical protein
MGLVMGVDGSNTCGASSSLHLIETIKQREQAPICDPAFSEQRWDFIGLFQLLDCKIRVGNKQEYGLKSGINDVSSTGRKQLWRQRGCSDIWNDQPFTT